MKRVLVAPLDWGLGHATRCIPIIIELMKRNFKVYIAGSGSSLELLRAEFPRLEYFELPAYRPVYSSRANMATTMLLQVPRFVWTIFSEHKRIETLVAQHNISFVISDNRYGCWTSLVPCVIVTHQLNIQLPKGFSWLNPLIKKINHRLIRKFTACWIPDFPEHSASLSGELSRSTNLKVQHVGPLSRFSYKQQSPDNRSCKYDVVCIVSGPEPQRSIFERKLLDILQPSGLRYVVASGVVAPNGHARSGTDEIRFLDSQELFETVCQTNLVITRSGYSTIMDLAATGSKAVLVPTPGQTEQEYLAKRFHKKKIFTSVNQDDLSLSTVVGNKNYGGGLQVDWHYAAKLLNMALDKI